MRTRNPKGGTKAPASAREAEQAHLLRVYAQLPIEPVSAEGVYLHTSDGRKILDLYGGHAVASLGYAHPRIVETLRRQAETMTFQSNAVALEVRARAATRLAALAPPGLERVFLVNSGAEANENALRLAFMETKREKVVAVEHGFHGRTAAAGAVTWGSDKWYAFPRTPFPVSFVPRNETSATALDAIDASTAAVIVEPIQGIAGAFDLDRGFLEALRVKCDETGAVLVFDEVQCGVGRSGFGFAAEKYGIVPDVLTTAKALGAGFPVAAVLVNERVAASAGIGSLGTTFGGGPLACAVLLAVLDVIEADALLANVRRVSEKLRSHCVVGPVDSIQGSGFLLGLRCSPEIKAAEVRDALLEQDILVGTSGDPQVVRLMPPLILEEEAAVTRSAALAKIG
jgi:acetylornithine/succinyldiaminopimelate/putrescine aminotransferase